MQEKREFPRYQCMLKVKFHYYDGDPDDPNLLDSTPRRGKGRILDISKGGIFIASHSKAGINLPVTVSFRTNTGIYTAPGVIVRTGLIRNNPADVLNKFKNLNITEEAYLAIKFDTPLDSLNSTDLDFP